MRDKEGGREEGRKEGRKEGNRTRLPFTLVKVMAGFGLLLVHSG